MAVALSRPLVLLSQHWSGLPPKLASAMLTRLRSPPDTPRTKSFPTLVLYVCDSPKTAMITSVICFAYCFRLTPGNRFRGALAWAAKLRVCPTCMVWRSVRMYLTAIHWSRWPYGKLREMDIDLSLIHALEGISMVLSIHRDTHLATKVRMHSLHPSSFSTKLRMKRRIPSLRNAFVKSQSTSCLPELFYFEMETCLDN